MSFAESGDCTFPGAALMADGYERGSPIAYDEFNWLLRDLYRRAGGGFTSARAAVEQAPDAVSALLASLGPIGADVKLSSDIECAAGYGAVWAADALYLYTPISTDTKKFGAYNPETGALVWTGEKATCGNVYALAAGYGYVVAAYLSGFLYVVFDAATGNVVATVAADGAEPSFVACGPSGFVAGTDGGGDYGEDALAAYDYAGAHVTTYTHGGGVVHDAAICGDLVLLYGEASTVGSYTARLLTWGAPMRVLWSSTEASAPSVGFCGFCGDLCALFDTAGSAWLIPVGRTASAPASIVTAGSLDKANASGRPSFTARGIRYIRNNSARKPCLLDLALELQSLGEVGGFDSCVDAGNALVCFGDSATATRISTSRLPVRVFFEGGCVL